MEVIETASTIDVSNCPDENVHIHHADLFNGLLGRDNLNEAIQLPIGIIPAGSDNSLVWTVLGIRDPVSAANAVAKGDFTPIDVFDSFLLWGYCLQLLHLKAQHDDGNLDLILVRGSGKTSLDRLAVLTMDVVLMGSFFVQRAKLNGSARCFQHKAGCLAGIPEL
ncbi:hypothetical protein EJB05_31302, partial [Eragrostis curvula]